MVLFVNFVPMALTYVDYGHLPVYAFLWCVVGFAAVAMCNSSLLVKQFAPYLISAEENTEDGRPNAQKKSEQEILEEMKRLGM